jgi:hypothetical protein
MNTTQNRVKHLTCDVEQQTRHLLILCLSLDMIIFFMQSLDICRVKSTLKCLHIIPVVYTQNLNILITDLSLFTPQWKDLLHFTLILGTGEGS